MKVLTASEMREVDRLTIERGIPGLVLMENAGNRVVDFLRERFAPLSEHRVAVICGKGNNGGDGFVVARQLFTRQLCRELIVFELFDSNNLSGDALTKTEAAFERAVDHGALMDGAVVIFPAFGVVKHQVEGEE